MSSKSHPDCEELQSRLHELTEHELQEQVPTPLKDRLLEHARQCSECGPLLENYRSLLSEIASLPRIKAPLDLAKKVRAAIDAEEHSPALVTSSSGAQPREAAPLKTLAPGAGVRASSAGRRILPQTLLRIAALITFAALGWLVAERFTSRRAEPAPALVARGPEKDAPSKLARGFEVPPAAPLKELQDGNAPVEVVKAKEFKESDQRSLPAAAPEMETGGSRQSTVDSRQHNGRAADEGGRDTAAEKLDGEAGAALGGGSSPLVIQLPPQDEESMRSLIVLAGSFAEKPGSVERRDDAAAHQRFIVFDMDAGRAQALQLGLQEFQSDRDLARRDSRAQLRAPIANGTPSPSRRRSERGFALGKDAQGLGAAEGVTRERGAKAEESATVAAATPGSPSSSTGVKPDMAVEPKPEDRKNERSEPEVLLAGRPTGLPKKRLAGQPAASSSAPAAASIPPPPPAPTAPAPGSAADRQLAKDALVAEPAPQPVEAESLARSSKIGQVVMEQNAQTANESKGTQERFQKGRAADLHRLVTPDGKDSRDKNGEPAPTGALGRGGAGAGLMPEGVVGAKAEKSGITSFFAPDGAAAGRQASEDSAYKESAPSPKAQRPAPPGKVRVVIQVELK